MTGDVARAWELRESACEQLLPHAQTPREVLEHLNDTSIGYITIVQVFDAYLEDR